MKYRVEKYVELELWVNFDQKDCFLTNNLELLLIFLMLVQIPSVRYLQEAVSLRFPSYYITLS